MPYPPGPWVRLGLSINHPRTGVALATVFDCYQGKILSTKHEAEDIAQVMTCAPELLEQLETMMQCLIELKLFQEDDEFFADANRLIAKARGQPYEEKQ